MDYHLLRLFNCCPICVSQLHLPTVKLASGVAVAATPWQLTPVHPESQKRRHLHQDLKTLQDWVLRWMNEYWLYIMNHCFTASQSAWHVATSGINECFTHPALQHWLEHISHGCASAILRLGLMWHKSTTDMPMLTNSSPHVNMCEIIGKCYLFSVHIYPDKIT